MAAIEQLSSLLRKHTFTQIQVLHLDRTNPKGNRSAARAFAAKIDAALSGFQDSDVYLVALTVNHKR
jgi:hypothetical protein